MLGWPKGRAVSFHCEQNHQVLDSSTIAALQLRQQSVAVQGLGGVPSLTWYGLVLLLVCAGRGAERQGRCTREAGGGSQEGQGVRACQLLTHTVSGTVAFDTASGAAHSCCVSWTGVVFSAHAHMMSGVGWGPGHPWCHMHLHIIVSGGSSNPAAVSSNTTTQTTTNRCGASLPGVWLLLTAGCLGCT